MAAVDDCARCIADVLSGIINVLRAGTERVYRWPTKHEGFTEMFYPQCYPQSLWKMRVCLEFHVLDPGSQSVLHLISMEVRSYKNTAAEFPVRHRH